MIILNEMLAVIAQVSVLILGIVGVLWLVAITILSTTKTILELAQVLPLFAEFLVWRYRHRPTSEEARRIEQARCADIAIRIGELLPDATPTECSAGTRIAEAILDPKRW